MKKIIATIVWILFGIFNVNSQIVGDSTEFRGIWISTVKKLDFPSHYNMTSDEIKKEIVTILDSCKAVGFNTIIFQVRPSADAFYNSKYEPWSEWLTGKQGRAPSPYFDPLKFIISETHKRNMKFHAWINPFRAVATISKADVRANHILKQKPEWFFDYGKNKYFNPGIPAVQDYIIKIIADITTRYDIDGIHFDDYFYPYPLRDKQNKIIDIPDYETFKQYGGNFKNIKDWRRDNINRFIKRVSDTIKAIKPNVKFGISPPAVWRNKGHDPKGSNTLGLASYDWIYADVLLWVKNAWIDYVAPQLYWYIGHKKTDYKVLLQWWTKNCDSTDLYIGLNAQALISWNNDSHYRNPKEIPNQIRLARQYPQVKGFIFYRYSSIMANPLGIKDSLKNDFFANNQPLAVVAVNNNNNIDTNAVVVNLDTTKINDTLLSQSVYPPVNVETYKLGKEVSIVWEKNQKNEENVSYRIYKYEKNEEKVLDITHFFAKTDKNFYRFETDKKVMLFAKRYIFVVTSVDENGKESEFSNPVYIRLRN